MIPQASITAWRTMAPWSDDAQVEQDLVLSRAVAELFAEPKLAGKIVLRGGTSLNKLFIQPASRYSEDIDLVQSQAGPIGPILDTIRRRLDLWLGTPVRSRATGGVTLTYRFQSEIAPIRPLRLKIEINTREHFATLGMVHRPFVVENPWFSTRTEVATYELDELMGTKLRALYQRRKGRDLFDLWLCLSRGLLNVERVLGCFAEYMKAQGQSISRAEFEKNLHAKRNNPAFLDDIKPLLRVDVRYDAREAVDVVCKSLIERLPGEPWRGLATGDD